MYREAGRQWGVEGNKHIQITMDCLTAAFTPIQHKKERGYLSVCQQSGPVVPCLPRLSVSEVHRRAEATYSPHRFYTADLSHTIEQQI